MLHEGEAVGGGRRRVLRYCNNIKTLTDLQNMSIVYDNTLNRIAKERVVGDCTGFPHATE